MSVLHELPETVPTGRSGNPGNRIGSARAWLVANARLPVSAWLAPHLVLTAVMLVILDRAGLAPGAALRRWDGAWYLDIARNGYIRHLSIRPNGTPRLMNAAFFPVYPYLIRAVHLVTFLPLTEAGLAISLAAGMVAAVGIHLLLKPYIGQRASIIAAGLWGVVPAAFVESMVYTEALFTAMCVWLMYALLRERWLTTGLLTVLAGLTRSTAVDVIPVVCLAALIAILQRRGTWRTWVCMVTAPVGLLSFLAFLAVRFHRLDAWFFIQSAPGWKSSFDFGRSTLHILKSLFLFEGLIYTWWMPYLLATVSLVPAVLITVLMVKRRKLPWQLITWTVLTLCTTLLTSGTYAAKPRFLLPCVALLASPAAVLDRSRRTTLITIFISLALFGGWVGAFYLKFTDFPP
jgi:Gpi18-like mannosyltransferase